MAWLAHQVLNGNCFNAPALAGGLTVSANGGFKYPYMSQTPYFSNDLALYRTFHIYEKQQVQFRISAFDWLNHSLLTSPAATPTTVNYNVDYATNAIYTELQPRVHWCERVRCDDRQVSITVCQGDGTGREVLVLIAALHHSGRGLDGPLPLFLCGPIPIA